MAKQSVVFEGPTELASTYLAPYCRSTGDVCSSLFQPEGYSLWKVTADLGDGAQVEWGDQHGDEAIFVEAGEIEVDDRRCGPTGVVIVEADVPAVVRARAFSKVLHFGPVDTAPPSSGPLGPPALEGRAVHVFTEEDAEKLRTAHMTYYSDGTCATCRAAIFTMDRRDAPEPRVYGSHVHSEDEIIHVLDGAIDVGRFNLPAGRGLAVPGGVRYGFRSSGPLRFVNYRRDISTSTHAPGSSAELETRQRIVDRVARGQMR